MLDTGASMDDIAAEMRRRWGFRPREAYRHAHGWSQDEVAVRFAGIAGRLGSGPAAERPPVTMVGTRIGEYERWPHGGRRPSPYVLTVLAEVYGTVLDALLDAADLAELPEQDRTVLAAVSTGRPAPRPARTVHVPRGPVPTPPPVVPPVVRIRDEELRARTASILGDSDRLLAVAEAKAAERTAAQVARAASMPFLAADPVGMPSKEAGRIATVENAERDSDTRALLVASAAEAAEFGEWADAVHVGPSTLEQLHDDVRRIAHDFLTSAPVPLLYRIMRLRNRVFTLLEQRQRPKQARELYLLAGRLCGLAAWSAGDLGFPAEAATHARTAWLSADLAGSPGLQGWVRATQSKLAYWDGRPRESAELAEHGLSLGIHDSGRTLLASLAARAWARQGDVVAARRSLRRVDVEREALSADDELGGIYGCSEAQQHYLAGTTFMWLREPGRAREAADRAVWLFELTDPRRRFYGAEALAQLDSAIAQVTLGDVEGAATRIKSLLALPPSKRVDVIMRRADDLERLLRQGPGQGRSAVVLADDIAQFRHAG
jgi:transcriptional regulator with XRE-family HTH domain